MKLESIVKKLMRKENPYYLYRFLNYFIFGFLLELKYIFLNKFSNNYGITKKKRKAPLIVSLTSFPYRIKKVYLGIETILRQTEKPDYIYLCLATDEFPNQKKDLPRKLLDLEKRGLTIKFYEKNLKPYNKLIHTLKENPNANIITVDDDQFYSNRIVKDLYMAHKKHPKEIIGKVATEIYLNDIMNIHNAQNRVKKEKSSHYIFLLGACSILYPPNSFNEEVFNEKVFLKIAPSHDDVWFKAMSLLNGRKCRKIACYERNNTVILGTQKNALWRKNKLSNQHYIQTEKVFDKYNLYKMLK